MGGIKGDGKFPVAMMMYQTDEYKIVYDSPPTLNVDSRYLNFLSHIHMYDPLMHQWPVFREKSGQNEAVQ